MEAKRLLPTTSQDEEIIVGDYQLDKETLFAIVRDYVGNVDVDTIADRLGLYPEDVIGVLQSPDVVAKAISARRAALQLIVYGPLADSLLTTAMGAGDARARVAAAKLLLSLAGEATKPTKQADKEKTFNLAVLVGGRYDELVREMSSIPPEQTAKVIGMIRGSDYEETDNDSE